MQMFFTTTAENFWDTAKSSATYHYNASNNWTRINMNVSNLKWAGQTINKSLWAAAYYRQQRDKGSSYQAAVRSLAFKWIRILYRCWQTNTPYDESRYLNALRKRGSPLLKNLESNARNA